MPPTRSRDFQRIAIQRLTAAGVLLQHRFNLDAQYLGGYTVECSLKAMILDKTSEVDKADRLQQISAGAKMYRADVMLGILWELKVVLPLRLISRKRRFDWTTDLRYEVGRGDTGETIGLIKTAQAIHDWVEENLS